MGRFDFESIIEILRLAMVPAAGTMSMILGKQVRILDTEVSLKSLEEVKEVVPCPGVALGTQLVKGEDRSRQMFLFSEKLAKASACLVMGSEDRDQELDDIMLTTIKEVISQSVESSAEAMSEFLGFELREEVLGLLRMREIGQLESWCDSLDMSELILAGWEMEIADTVKGYLYGVIPLSTLRLLGIGLRDELHQRKTEDVVPSRPKRSVKVSEVCFPEFKVKEQENTVERIDDSRETLQDISLGISVEVGHVECLVEDILNLKEGQVLMLDKQAGSPADIVVNGEFIARGDVFVMDDKFAARVTEIVNRKG